MSSHPSPTGASLPSWPPEFTPAQKSHLLQLATTWALGNGFTLLPPPNSSTPAESTASSAAPTNAIPAPLSLCPTPFPKHLYELAREIQPVYSALYVAVTQSPEFLDKVMGGTVSRVDEFQGRLWMMWRDCRDDLVQPLQLGLFRSDYLLHQPDPSVPPELKQVEFNTISSSFGVLSDLAGRLHRHLLAKTAYFNASSDLSVPHALPPNESIRDLSKGLVRAHQEYISRHAQQPSDSSIGTSDVRILFVVQDDDDFSVNAYSAAYFELPHGKSGAQVIRQSFAQLAQSAIIKDTRLFVRDELANASYEISLVYYRAGYTPNDYTSDTVWQTRELIERSLAIKCPSLALQLAGAKKVQQVLAEEGMLEHFILGNGSGSSALGPADIEKLRSTFSDLYPMDDSPLGKEAQRLAVEEPQKFVLKPQREGGGNNIYRENIPGFLKQLEKEELQEDKPRISTAEFQQDPVAAGDAEPPKREGYILMSLIDPPQDLRNLLVKGGSKEIADGPVVSELGVYGVALFEGPKDPKTVYLETAGTLLRTKGRESDEGGVAVGYSVVDSVLLV